LAPVDVAVAFIHKLVAIPDIINGVLSYVIHLREKP